MLDHQVLVSRAHRERVLSHGKMTDHGAVLCPTSGVPARVKVILCTVIMESQQEERHEVLFPFCPHPDCAHRVSVRPLTVIPISSLDRAPPGTVFLHSVEQRLAAQ